MREYTYTKRLYTRCPPKQLRLTIICLTVKTYTVFVVHRYNYIYTQGVSFNIYLRLYIDFFRINVKYVCTTWFWKIILVYKSAIIITVDSSIFVFDVQIT
jgi:hypothetical protein